MAPGRYLWARPGKGNAWAGLCPRDIRRRRRMRVAKRGHPGTAHAGKWIPLEPGCVVISDADLSVLTIEKNGVVRR